MTLEEKYNELLMLVKDIYRFSDDKLDKKWCEHILKYIGELNDA